MAIKSHAPHQSVTKKGSSCNDTKTEEKVTWYTLQKQSNTEISD